MKTTIPDELKADIPQTTWGKILTATPIIMTVVATMLAGLSSSEMTRAQYDRSMAAQLQSKAGDQWSYFQAKRLRSALQHNTLDILQNTGETHALDVGELKKLDTTSDSPAKQQALDALQKGELPTAAAPAAMNPKVAAALDAVANSRPETEISNLLWQVDGKTLDEAMRQAQDQATAFDTALKPLNQAIDRLEKVSSTKIANGADASTPGKSLSRDFTAARLRYTASRYDAESRLNQTIGTLYELQVRKSNASAARHHERSQRLFFGMLGAQMAVIIATFAIAARKRNLLWSIAAAAGAAAISFALYVYLFL